MHKDAAYYSTVTDLTLLERDDKFDELADAQRGLPESAMLRCQHHILGAGVGSFVLEHCGDITNRMAQHFSSFEGQYGIVKDKVMKCLRYLTQDYGFEREMNNNLKNNYDMRVEDKSPKLKGRSFEEVKNEYFGLWDVYADAHSQLRVFNYPQRIARDAAVALGLRRFTAAIHNLTLLKTLIDKGPETYSLAAGEYNPAKKVATQTPPDGLEITSDYGWHEHGTPDLEKNLLSVFAKLGGEVIADAEFIIKDNYLLPNNVTVDKNYRRQGIASAMYAFAEQETGLKCRPHNIQSGDGYAFWNQNKDRKFGSVPKLASHKTPALSTTTSPNMDKTDGEGTNAYALLPDEVEGTSVIPKIETMLGGKPEDPPQHPAPSLKRADRDDYDGALDYDAPNYVSGECYQYAIALVELTGFEPVEFWDEEGPIHTAVIHPNGKFLDAGGLVTLKQLEKRYGVKLHTDEVDLNHLYNCAFPEEEEIEDAKAVAIEQLNKLGIPAKTASFSTPTLEDILSMQGAAGISEMVDWREVEPIVKQQYPNWDDIPYPEQDELLKPIILPMLQPRFDAIMAQFNKRPSLTVYRAIDLPGGLKNVQKDFAGWGQVPGFGMYWAWDESGAKSYNSNHGAGEDYVFRGVVHHDGVDWDDTFLFNVTNDEEKEIRLYSGVKVELDAYRYKDGPWTPVEPEFRNVTAARVRQAITNFEPLPFEEFLKQEGFWGMAQGMDEEEMAHREQEYAENVEHFGTMDFPLTVWRALEVPEGQPINFDQAGIYWTWVENSADAYFGGTSMWTPKNGPKGQKGELVLIEAQIMNASDVDWKGTMRANFIDAEENEVRVFSGAQLKLVGVQQGEDFTYKPVPGKTVVTATAKPKSTTDTQNFKTWFTGSKVVDKRGRPLKVYHGTRFDFEWFDPRQLGKNTNHTTSRLGFYFTTNPDVTQLFQRVGPDKYYMPGAHVKVCYLNIKNPLVLTASEFREFCPSQQEMEENPEAVKAREQKLTEFGHKLQGHDGIQILADSKLKKNPYTEYRADSWVAFRSEQIKSAIGNNGEFDPDKVNITASKKSYGVVMVDMPKGITETFEIDEEDLAGSGREGDAHITVRYGIESGDDLKAIKELLSNTEPFTVTLGKTGSFPPSKSSDGAAVVIVHVKSPELHKLNDALGKIGTWKKSDFDEYKPHMTVAYVKEGTEGKYTDLDTLEGIEHEVTELVISDADKKHHVVKFSRRKTSSFLGLWSMPQTLEGFAQKYGGFKELVNYAHSGDDWEQYHPYTKSEEAEYSALTPEKQDEWVTARAYEDWSTRYKELLWMHGSWTWPLTVWREVTLKDLNSLKTKGIGIYWAYEEVAAEAHWGDFSEGTNKYTLEALINETSVDWEGTMLSNLSTSTGDVEKEITLKEGTPIKITRWKGEDGVWKKALPAWKKVTATAGVAYHGTTAAQNDRNAYVPRLNTEPVGLHRDPMFKDDDEANQPPVALKTATWWYERTPEDKLARAANWAERSNLPVDGQLRVRLYHATPAVTATPIEQEGLRKGSYLAIDAETALHQAGRDRGLKADKLVCFECWVPLNALIPSIWGTTERALSPEELSLKRVIGKK